MFYISSDITGVPYNIWITCSKAELHDMIPHVKVEVKKYNYVSMTISNNPEIVDITDFSTTVPQHKIQLVKRYIKNYKNILLAHYEQKIDDLHLVSCLGALNRSKQFNKKLNRMLDLADEGYSWEVIDAIEDYIENHDVDNHVFNTVDELWSYLKQD